MKGEEDHLRVELKPSHLFCHAEAIEPGHIDVKNGQLRLMPPDQIQRLNSVARLSDDLEGWIFFYAGLQAPPHHGVVVCQQNLDLVSHLYFSPIIPVGPPSACPAFTVFACARTKAS